MVELLIFWIAVFLIFHSYVLFPVILFIIARFRNDTTPAFSKDDDLPEVSIIISVYNEERVIEQRINNIFLTSYPVDKIEVLVGSDGSTDNTNALLSELQHKHPQTKVFEYQQRKGKGNVLNALVSEASGKILILTDAKVEFGEHSIFELVKNFKDEKIGIVGGNIINRNERHDGISIQEKRFMSNEVMMKHNEGKIWGTMIGAYGACFAIRRECFVIIPESFAVEDFYITLKVLQNGYKAILNLDAHCFEDVPNRIHDEFRRKVRISSGNFQNMRVLTSLLFRFNPLSFCFFSHKVIRWHGPFLLILALVSNIFLAFHSSFYLLTLGLQLFLMIVPIIDFFLQKIHLHNITLRFVTHFYSMNIALLVGFIKYVKGAKTNVWEPTTRSYQKT